jgi:hypothetical protein
MKFIVFLFSVQQHKSVNSLNLEVRFVFLLIEIQCNNKTRDNCVGSHKENR